MCSSWVGCCATVLLLQHVHLNPFCFPGLITTAKIWEMHCWSNLCSSQYQFNICACKTYLENHYGSYMPLPAAAQRCRGPCNEGNDLQRVQQKRACHQNPCRKETVIVTSHTALKSQLFPFHLTSAAIDELKR